MDFDELLWQARELLQQQQRVSYRALKVRLQLDDDHLEAVKDELIYAQQVAKNEQDRVLVWTGEPVSTPAPGPEAPSATDREPRFYTPRYLTEKILTSRSALEGERKQVTVLFADIKDSTELIRDLAPEGSLRSF